MSAKSTWIRSLHDVGLAAWFGGSLMGAVGVQGAADAVDRLDTRVRIADEGWRRWQPYDVAAIGAHLVGGIGLLATNKARIATQPGARANNVAKTALTGVALGLSAHNKHLGRVMADGGDRDTQRRLRTGQWALPAVTGALVVLGAAQGEQQRPRSILRAQARRLPRP